jgi:hypothetical protein
MTFVPAHRTSRALVLLLSAGLLTSAAIGAATNGQAASPAQGALEHLTIKLSNPHVPSQIPAGILALTVVNDTNAESGVDLGRANPGATLAQIKAVSNGQSISSFIRLTQLVTFLGGANSVPPGASEAVIVDVRTPGIYGLHIGGNNGPGTDTTFKVTGEAGRTAALPGADLVVRLKDMKILGLPKHLAAGRISIKVTSQGPSVHEMVVVRLNAGKTQRDVQAYLRSPEGANGGPPDWVHAIGGMETISPHQSAVVTLKLIPGYYVAVCFMPDVKKHGIPHVMEGMITHFTVS